MAQRMAFAPITPHTERISDELEKGDLAQARALCESLLKRFPNHPEALYMQALLSHAAGDKLQAVKLLQRAVSLVPEYEGAWYNMAIMLAEIGMQEESCKAYLHLLAINPQFHAALFNLAGMFHEARQLGEAERYYRKFLELTPYHSGGNANLGAVLIDQGRYDEALPFCEKAVMLSLGNVEARNNCAIIYAGRGQLDKAETAFKRILVMTPEYEPAQINLAHLQTLRAAPQMQADQRQALEALFNQANALLSQGALEEAVEAYEQALTLNAGAAEIYINLAMALSLMRQFEPAHTALKRALALDAGNANAYLNLGNLYKDQGQYEPAAAAYKKALSLRSEFFEARLNLGVALRELGRYDEALAAYEQSLRLDPKKMLSVDGAKLEALGMLIRDREQLCIWENLEAYTQELLALVDAGMEKASLTYFTPSTLLLIDSTPKQQWQAAVRYSADKYGKIEKPYEISRLLPSSLRKGGRIRIGYLSGDFYNHATAFLIAGLFEQHDREAFEIYAYAYGKENKSAIRARIEKGVDVFRDIDALSDSRAAEQIAADGIDILVDLKGYTRDHRLGICAMRPAPINVHYLGYPGTTGASFIDYFIADAVVAPEAFDGWFTEKLVRLPHSYQVNDDQREMDALPTRKECGLPEKGFVFCSFNQNYKITPRIFDVWMRLLDRVPGSVLWLYITADVAQENLRAEAKRRGVAPERLIFATYKPQAEHLARLTHADLFLDTLPINAHTTASDALWCGVPVVTCAGESFVSRVAASVLAAAGMPQLVAENLQAYESLALKIAQEPALLLQLKDKINSSRASMPLFNTQATTRHIEAAYRGMVARHKEGKQPEAFVVHAED